MGRRRWLRRIVLVLVVLLAADTAVSAVLRLGRLHRYLVTRLEATFGRPVEVSNFGFSLLEGPRLEANYITIAEDPRFGYEYFLRAERLAAGPRWNSLLRGRFEFGTLSFVRPSLNLVRLADGHWNLESWLPPPPSAGPARSSAPALLYRIEVDTGRINFKRGLEKHPFALADVKGHVEQEGTGRWRIDLEARPMRAAVQLQEAGKLRLRGRIAGTSARLQPAELALTWQEVSLADALRLWRGWDFGVRGRLDVEMSARIAAPEAPLPSAPGAVASKPAEADRAGSVGGSQWTLAMVARLRGVHRWDFPPRVTDPPLNLNLEARWRPGEPRLELGNCLMEAPRSTVRAVGRIEWGSGIDPEIRLLSSRVNLADLLAWYRAFRPGVADGLSIQGSVGTDLLLKGWPPRLEEGVLAGDGARVSVPGLAGPLDASRITARVRRGGAELLPVTITLRGAKGANPPARAAQAARDDALRLEGSLRRRVLLEPDLAGRRDREWKFELSLEGESERAQDWRAAAQAFGLALGPGWSVEGPAALRVRWRGTLFPFSASALGSMDFKGLRLRAGYLNQPVTLANARLELLSDEERVTLQAAQGFGAHWSGTLRRSLQSAGEAPEPWEFDLAADRLDAAQLDRWLGPRARPSFLQLVVPFVGGGRAAPDLEAFLRGLRGRGRIRVDECRIAPLRLHRLRAMAEIEGRKIRVHDVQADFYRGTVRGELEAELAAQPSYRISAPFEHVDLASLAGDTSALKDRVAGVASGELELATRGVGREDLLRALEGRGRAEFRGAQIHGLDLTESAAAGSAQPGNSALHNAAVEFRVQAGKIQVRSLRFTTAGATWSAEGSVDFARGLDLLLQHVQPAGKGGLPVSKAASGITLRLTGPLEKPQIARVQPQARR